MEHEPAFLIRFTINGGPVSDFLLAAALLVWAAFTAADLVFRVLVYVRNRKGTSNGNG